MANNNMKMVELANRAVEEQWSIEELLDDMGETNEEVSYTDSDEGFIQIFDENDNYIVFFIEEGIVTELIHAGNATEERANLETTVNKSFT